MADPTPTSQRGLPVGAFGKIPNAGDFVRAGLSNEATRSFEAWLHRGIEVAHEKHGSKWKAPFLAGATYAFVYRAPVGDGWSTLCGVLKPSQDSVGRAFPLSIFAVLPEHARFALGPLVLGGFLDGAASVALGSADLESALALEKSLDSVACEMPWAPIENDYDSWIRMTRLSSVWQWIFANNDMARPLQALYTIAEMARPLRGCAPPGTQLGIRFPLGRMGVEGASFWLDLVAHAFASSAQPPSFFWHFNGSDGDLLVQLGRTPAWALPELWVRDMRNESLSDLIALSPMGDPFRFLSPALRQCLQRPTASVFDLLRAVTT